VRPAAVAALAAALLALVATLAGCTTVAAAGDVTDTWKNRIAVNPQGSASPVPVVLFVHGCSGLGPGPGALYPDTRAWVQTITTAGCASWRRTHGRAGRGQDPIVALIPTGPSRLWRSGSRSGL